MDIDLNSIPFQIMQCKYATPVLMHLLAEDHAYPNQLVKALNGEWTTVGKALTFLTSVGYLTVRDLGEHRRPRHEYSLSPIGRKVAHILKVAYDQLLQVPTTEATGNRHQTR